MDTRKGVKVKGHDLDPKRSRSKVTTLTFKVKVELKVKVEFEVKGHLHWCEAPPGGLGILFPHSTTRREGTK